MQYRIHQKLSDIRKDVLAYKAIPNCSVRVFYANVAKILSLLYLNKTWRKKLIWKYPGYRLLTEGIRTGSTGLTSHDTLIWTQQHMVSCFALRKTFHLRKLIPPSADTCKFVLLLSASWNQSVESVCDSVWKNTGSFSCIKCTQVWGWSASG